MAGSSLIGCVAYKVWHFLILLCLLVVMLAALLAFLVDVIRTQKAKRT